ncbi:unnamed protein product [Darwinula stevensoni]|uniref:Fe2OG dioxygenase domain-containing protein n=1 Tax=Darwinula stevensoni TaxID=69355 RepID=A0A7R8WZM3_9CRUS|nr:unnamed protein product [Darwinula stevensoni]CAG0880738.1 unnamed protein product [Darwinula stevensoni]
MSLDESKREEIRETYDMRDFSPSALFPDQHVPKFRLVFEELYRECRTLGHRLLDYLGIGLGLEEGFLSGKHRNVGTEWNGTALRTLFYPPVSVPEEDYVIRCASHSDYGSLTLLFQDDVGGLEVQTKAGEWVEARPVPEAILINVGDLLELWTAGLYRATPHRVILGQRRKEDSERGKRFRQSIAFFFHPDNDVTVEPVVTAANSSRQWIPLNAWEHLKSRFTSTYDN